MYKLLFPKYLSLQKVLIFLFQNNINNKNLFTNNISNVFNHTEREWTTWGDIHWGTALFFNNLCHNLTLKCRGPVFMYIVTHTQANIHHLYTTYTRRLVLYSEQLTREMHRLIVSQCHTHRLYMEKLTWSLVLKIDTKNKNIVICIYL